MSKTLVVTLALLVLVVYLFATAPPPLPLAVPDSGPRLPLHVALSLLEYENDVARSVYTREIVGAAERLHIDFREDWEDEEVHAGPLPAQFLRETARRMERDPVPLGLFLGSDHAINKANAFEGVYLEMFQVIRATRQPIYFYVEDAGRFAFMAPDIAVAKPCVECHNHHEDSDKKDWRLSDVMGATTWTYPRDTVTLAEWIGMLAALRRGLRAAYEAFLAEVKNMAPEVRVGHKWPRDGDYLPDADTFMAAVVAGSSARILQVMVAYHTAGTIEPQPETKVEPRAGMTAE